jgi:SAM-dependent methyltransferase
MATGLPLLRELPGKFRKSVARRGVGGTVALCCWKVADPLGNWLLPSRYRARRLDREFDLKHGVDTAGLIELADLRIESANARQGNPYAQTRPTDFEIFMKAVRANWEGFVFVDFGSGKGRALLLAAAYPFRKIVGVEFAAELHAAALENVRRFRDPTQRCGNFELHCMDAADFPVPRDPAVFYFYNPFREEVMARVLGNIRRSLDEHPREVFIIYCNSVLRGLVRQYGFEEVKAGRWYAIYKGPGRAAPAENPLVVAYEQSSAQ